MKHNNILYILLLIVLIFLIIYKKKHFCLEGYRYMWPNMAKKNNTNGVPYNNLSRSQCKNKCTQSLDCLAYVTTTSGGANSRSKGDCRIFKSTIQDNITDFNPSNLRGFKYSTGSYLYIN